MANRSKIVIALFVAGAVLILIFLIMLNSGDGNSTSDESSHQWGLTTPFPVSWHSPEPISPSQYPEVSTVDVAVEHFEIATETPSSTPPYARPITDVVCRTGPSTLYPPHRFLTPGESYPIDGQNPESTWWRLLLADDTSCWVWAELLDITGDIEGVPQLQPPPLPTATTRPDSPPSTSAGCWVIDPQHPNGYCRPGSCTPNDFPGTSCTIP